MTIKSNNFAYIDGANLHKALQELGWSNFDYARFRIWLAERYGVSRAYIFIGLIARYKNLYKYLQEAGFTLIFKEVVYDGNGKPKGNCDADLVLQAVIDSYENSCDKAILVAGDGDYASMVKFLKERDKIEVVLSPNTEKKCSILIKRTGVKISYISDQKSILSAQKEKTPGGDGTPQGFLS